MPILEGLGKKKIVHFRYFINLWYSFCDLLYFVAMLAYSFPLWFAVPRKIWQPCVCLALSNFKIGFIESGPAAIVLFAAQT
jgi:hypothetical protein